jgi:hypothetical protein
LPKGWDLAVNNVVAEQDRDRFMRVQKRKSRKDRMPVS